MTRAEFLKMMGAGAAVLALDAVPGASLIQSANAQKTPLKKNQERLAFAKHCDFKFKFHHDRTARGV